MSANEVFHKSKDEGMRIINILWTGGLDSTCRVAELSRQPIIIQPYYILDNDRKSIDKELTSIRRITSAIKSDKSTKCQLNDIITIEKSSIPKNEKITKAYLILKEKYSLGSQYDWLARFASDKNILLEMGLEKNPTGKAFLTITGECTLVEEKFDGIEEFRIDLQKSSDEAIAIFKNLRFPSRLWETDKVGEVELMKSLGLGHLILLTWFCHRPVLGMTCGHCNPCKDALNEGMAWRVSKLGYVLGTIRHYTFDIAMSILGKIRNSMTS